MTAVTYPSGLYASVTPQRHYVYDSATVNGQTMANAKGRLAEAYTGTGSPKITDLGFSYSPRGEAADLWQWSTNSGGWYHVAGAYWPTGPTGLLNTLTAPGLPVFTYNPDGEGRVGSVQAGSAYLVSGTQYNDFRSGWLPMVVNLGAAGSGDKDTFTFDTNTGRMSQYQATLANTSSLTGNLTWNGNGSLAQLGIVDQFYPANNQNCAYTHDELARISKVDCGNGFWGQTFAYNDAFGNVTKAGIVGRQGGSYTPTYSPSTNQISCTGCGYDSNGNLTADAPQPGGHSYAWDAEGKLRQYNGGAALVYDALGRRVEQPGAQILYGLGGGKLALMSGQNPQSWKLDSMDPSGSIGLIRWSARPAAIRIENATQSAGGGPPPVERRRLEPVRHPLLGTG